MLPVGGLGVDLVAEGVTAGLERHYRAGDELVGVVAEDPHASAGREPSREGTDRDQLETAVVLQSAHHAADGVRVHHHGAVGGSRLTRQFGGQRAAAGQRERHAEVVEDVADQLHHGVRAPRRAWGLQQREQRVDHPRAVGLGHGRVWPTVSPSCSFRNYIQPAPLLDSRGHCCRSRRRPPNVTGSLDGSVQAEARCQVSAPPSPVTCRHGLYRLHRTTTTISARSIMSIVYKRTSSTRRRSTGPNTTRLPKRSTLTCRRTGSTRNLPSRSISGR